MQTGLLWSLVASSLYMNYSTTHLYFLFSGFWLSNQEDSCFIKWDKGFSWWEWGGWLISWKCLKRLFSYIEIVVSWCFYLNTLNSQFLKLWIDGNSMLSYSTTMWWFHSISYWRLYIYNNESIWFIAFLTSLINFNLIFVNVL